MLCVIKEPLEAARIIEIENDLDALQKAVDGYIEVVHLTEDVLVIVDEEGLLKQKPMNSLGMVGTYVFCGDAADDFRSLTDDEAHQLLFILNNKSAR